MRNQPGDKDGPNRRKRWSYQDYTFASYASPLRCLSTTIVGLMTGQLGSGFLSDYGWSSLT